MDDDVVNDFEKSLPKAIFEVFKGSPLGVALSKTHASLIDQAEISNTKHKKTPKLSPKTKVCKSPSSTLKKALKIAQERVKKSLIGNCAFLTSEKVKEGKFLCKYGTYKLEQGKFGRYLKNDLLDKESKHTITLIVSEIYIADFVNLFEVDDFVRIEGESLKRKVFKDGGTCQWSLHVDATTFLVKSKAFDCNLTLYLEHRIRELLVASAYTLAQFNPTIAFTVIKVENVAKSDGTSSCRLTIVDGLPIIDRASLLFVPSRQVDYHTIVSAVNEEGYFSCIAHNINVFKQQTNTLSIVDATILLELPVALETLFCSHLSKQVSKSGFGKKIFGTLEILNLNSLDIQYTCDYCKGSNVSCQVLNPFCYMCGKLSTILKNPLLQAKSIPQTGEGVAVTLQGGIVDSVLGLPQPFMRLYEDNLVDLKASLATLKKIETFEIDKQGIVTDFKHS
ncbi:hypothetical protein L7F22_000796 [Adiantum nelumboides]|nr:hypothetical protein [Adiantum nelumboides]